MRDDAGFHAGRARRACEQARAANVLLAQQRAQFVAGLVLAGIAEQLRRRAERVDVACHVRRAAGHRALALEFHDRHRRFGRDAPDVAPHVTVQHHVADDEHARTGTAGVQFFEAFGWQNRQLHRNELVF